MKTVLVVDDDSGNRESYQGLFSIMGYNVLTAQNGAIGLELAVSNRPDLVLTDNRMSVMDGYEMARKLRSNPQTREIPIIGCGDFSVEQQEILDYFVEKGSGTSISDLVKKVLGEPTE